MLRPRLGIRTLIGVCILSIGLVILLYTTKLKPVYYEQVVGTPAWVLTRDGYALRSPADGYCASRMMRLARQMNEGALDLSTKAGDVTLTV